MGRGVHPDGGGSRPRLPAAGGSAGLSQPRLHVAGTLLFVLVPRGRSGLPGDPWLKPQAPDSLVPCLGRVGSVPATPQQLWVQALGPAQVRHKFWKGTGVH